MPELNQQIREAGQPEFQILETNSHILPAILEICCPPPICKILVYKLLKIEEMKYKLLKIEEMKILMRHLTSQTMDKLFFSDGAFFLFVTCNKAQGFGRLQSLLVSSLLSSSCLKGSSTETSSFTSSSKGRSGPMSRLGLMGFIVEALGWMPGYTLEHKTNELGLQI